MKADAHPKAAKTRLTPPVDDWRKFAVMTGGMALTLFAAYGFGLMLGAPPLAQFSLDWKGLLIGVAATAPLVLLLEWFMRARRPKLVAFREAQVEFFASVGFRFTPLRIAILAIGAGVTEELLFRGVFQAWAETRMSVVLAVILPNIVFGALHWRTTLYAVIAGVVGVYLGVLFLYTDNLLAPIIAHALYDAVALHKTERAIAARG